MTQTLIDRLPAPLLVARYNGARIPDGNHDLAHGANCQRFAYAVLAHFGVALPPWRSSELWADRSLTWPVDSFEPLDLLLFGRSADPYGAHVAVYIEHGRALHLSRSVGVPAIWTLEQFAERPEYRVLIGGKRAIALPSG